MALRIDAEADVLSLSSGLPSSTAFTLCGWFKRRGTGAGTNEISALLYGADPPNQYVASFIYSYSAANFRVQSSGGAISSAGLSITTDTWYFYALSCAGTGASDAKIRAAAKGATSFTEVTATGASFTPVAFSFGINGAGIWGNQALAGWKLFDRVLTDAELFAEMNRLTPASTTNLNAWWPMVHSATGTADNDFSGAGKDLSPAGTITLEDGPPVGWGAPLALVGAAASGSTGTLAATESGADTAALVGVALVDGSLAATESGSDVAALIGVALVSGTLAATETGDDAAVIAGSVLAQGTLAATESGSDVAAIEGVTVNVATGSLAATESGSDTAEIAGVVLARGTLAANDSGEDTAAITGVALVSGTLDATEAGSDTAVIAAVALVQGSLDATESGIDTAAIEGSLAVISTGSLAATESGSDTATFAGVAPVSGALAATEAANDSAAVSGVVLVTGALDATETGSDTAAFASSTPVTTAYPGPAGRATKGKRRRVVIRERVYEVNERDLPALLEAELLDRAPPVTAEVVEGPKPPRKRGKKATQPVKTVEQVQEAVAEIKARIEPDNGWLMQALEAVALRVLERIQDEEDSLILLLAA